MVANSTKENWSANTFDPKVPRINRLLRSALIYGPNASGKTNVLRAIEFVKFFVLNSANSGWDIENQYNPFKLFSTNRGQPSEFVVTFVQDDSLFEYGFSIDSKRVRSEWLIQYINSRGRELFSRHYVSAKAPYRWKLGPHLRGVKSTWKKATRENSLFLSTAIQLNNKQLQPVFDWFLRKLVIVFGAAALNHGLTIKLLESQHGKSELLPFLKAADLGISDLIIEKKTLPNGPIVLPGPGAFFVQDNPHAPPKVVTMKTTHECQGDENIALDLEEESKGTQILVRSAGAWLNVLNNGEVLFIDEIDASMHPLITAFILRNFHSERRNKKNAQLICTTHDVSLLDTKLVRRDQVWFTEKSPNGESRLFPLTDFHVRQEDQLERWYMRGRYGAIPIVESDI
jgi:AAA15 family ATPase/GTPase